MQIEMFVNLGKKYRKLDERDRLPVLKEIIPWESFRRDIMKAFRKQEAHVAGRKPYDHVMMFKVLVLQSLYALSDEQMEYQIHDRISFQRFLGLNLKDDVPDATTIWLYRETLGKGEVLKKLLGQFNVYLEDQGFRAREGTMVDATIVEVPVQRMTKEEREQLKQGEVPKEWSASVERRRHKDTDARWTKKNGANYYGYKNHVNVDKKYKLIRKFEVTNASMHESQVFEELLDKRNSGKKVWADAAYDTVANAKILKRHKLANRIQKQARGTQELPKITKYLNEIWGKTRKRVEHVFGFQKNSMKANFIRVIGIQRAKVKIGLNNLVHNFCRFQFLSVCRA